VLCSNSAVRSYMCGSFVPQVMAEVSPVK
jgi:hypothetical protein